MMIHDLFDALKRQAREGTIRAVSNFKMYPHVKDQRTQSAILNQCRLVMDTWQLHFSNIEGFFTAE